VFGSIPASNSTHPPPTAVYVVDAATPFTTAEPMATAPILNQPLFYQDQLSPGTHKLLINVTAVQAASPFSLDYFIITPEGSVAPESAIAAASASAISPPASSHPTSGSLSEAHTSAATVGILAGVLGSIIFILLCLSVFFFVIIRRRRRRTNRSKSFQSAFGSLSARANPY
jgi:hypothetical protein